jgi:phospholipase D1/2
VVRLLPLAPYSIVNLAAGAAQVRFRDFLIGTALGMLPGVIGASVFAEQLVRTLRQPDPKNVVLLIVVVATLLFTAGWIERRLTGDPGRAEALAAAFRRSGRTPGTAAPSPRR